MNKIGAFKIEMTSTVISSGGKRRVGRVVGKPTFHCFVPCSLRVHLRHDDRLKPPRPILLVKQIPDPLGARSVADCPADVVAGGEQLVCEVRGDVAVYTCDEDGGTFRDSCGHDSSRKVSRF